jgi:hypothetical protein
MSVDERASEASPSDGDEHAHRRHVDAIAHEDRPIAPAGPQGAELFDELRARIAELDAIAWNLPERRRDLLAPPDSAWPPVADDAA